MSENAPSNRKKEYLYKQCHLEVKVWSCLITPKFLFSALLRWVFGFCLCSAFVHHVYVISCKLEIPKECWDKCLFFLPIIRNLEYTTDEQTIGSFCYNAMLTHELPVKMKERKLTQLLSTHN